MAFKKALFQYSALRAIIFMKTMVDSTILKQWEEKWNFKQKGDIITTATSVVQFGSFGNTPSVLKIFNKNSDELLSSKALEYYQGNGAVRIIKSSSDAILLEQANPGKHLKEYSISGKDGEATQIFCEVITQLHSKKQTPDGFPEIADFWGKGFDRYLNSSDTRIAMPIVEKAKHMFSELSGSQGKQILLHGDLHHDNILFDEKRGWLAIDPKGAIGEAEIEVAAFLKNPIGHLEIYTDEKIIRNRISTISRELNLNQERILRWAFALTVLSAIWLTEIDENPDGWLALAEKLEAML